MPALLPAPRVPPGFSPQTARGTEAGGPTTSPGGQTARKIEADSLTVSPGGQTAHGTGAGGSTMSPGGRSDRPRNRGCQSDRKPRRPDRRGTGASGPTARPCAAPLSSASPTSTVSRAPPMTSAAPHVVPTTPATSHAAPASQLYPLHYSRRPRATREPPAPPLHQQSPPAKAAPMAPPINPHPITMRAKRGFRPTDSPYRPLRRQPCHRCLPPSAPPSSIQIGAAPWKKNLLP
jgi:hypothetical protein